MLKAGVAGIGFMGWIHWLAYQQVDGIEVAAIQSRNEKKRAGDWRGIQGNFGPPGAEVDLTGVSAYATFEEMLADPTLDLIDLCLPPDQHPGMAEQALQAGKHVFCEKPMALTAEACDSMVAAAEKAGKQLLIGHVLPFGPEYSKALQIIESGEYGKLLGGHFRRVISDPTWIEGFYDPHKSGGPLIDLHVHDAHFIRLLFGMPTTVTSQGRMRGEVVEYCDTLFGFEDPSLVVSSATGVIYQQGRPFMHSFEIHLEKATLQFELQVFADGVETLPLKILASDGQVLRPDLGLRGEVDGFIGEIQEMVGAITSGKPSAILGGQLARDAVVLCQKQTESVRERRAVEV
ncbi:Gfo/Idh/MocA family protein [Lignipirellula cremea]|uniref:Glucose--fructose oxidoreductase n=1 Tax=Lignipirellula cremea TaxID=2528010 RepID=A0A518E2Q1_9BACT|nr:Gfo/Idh/MocA family oxidoreductase [Lignipirellula cremea]QDU98371.1 Glucose--fructose oxidoreductase precursor [Lignipirellula cremea]